MYKLISNTGYKINTYDIYELWRFIVSNNMSYTITKNYFPISTNDFLNIFLKETKNWKDYHSLYLKLKPTISIKKYIK